MQVVQKYHTKGDEATVVQPTQSPGIYFFIEEEDKFYHWCYRYKETAERVMLTLQASWDELINKLKVSKINLKDLLKAPKYDILLISQIAQHIAVLEDAIKGRSERDRDVFLNFDDKPSDCRISTKKVNHLQLQEPKNTVS